MDLPETTMLRQVFDAHVDCIKILDLEGRLLQVNAGGLAALELLGPGEVVGRYWPDLWVGEGHEKAKAALRVAATGQDARFSGPALTAKGTPKHWDVRVSAILDGSGEPSSILVVSRDITDQTAVAETLAERDALHRAILQSSTDYAIIASDRDGLITVWNEGARRIMQWAEEEVLGTPADLIFTEEDRAAGVPRAEMAAALQKGRGEDERWHRRKDDTRFWANGLMMPLRTQAGRDLGFIKILRDRTEARHAEEHRQLLMEELNHRMKNTLAVVQGIVSQTLRTASSPEAARRDVMDRLTVLSQAQDILTRTSWAGAPLHEVVKAAVAPLAQVGSRLTLEGPEVDLGPSAVLSLTMALHELGTNATKYGAFSNDTGRVSIRWRVDHDDFGLTWRESGGPTVTPPARQGFGSRLISGGLARGLGGQAALEFRPQGVEWSVRAPLAALEQA